VGVYRKITKRHWVILNDQLKTLVLCDWHVTVFWNTCMCHLTNLLVGPKGTIHGYMKKHHVNYTHIQVIWWILYNCCVCKLASSCGGLSGRVNDSPLVILPSMTEAWPPTMGCLPIPCQIPVIAYNYFTTPNYFHNYFEDTLHIAHMPSVQEYRRNKNSVWEWHDVIQLQLR